MALTPPRPLPWTGLAPYDEMQWTLWDADGNLVAECVGDDDDGHTEAVTIIYAVNKAGPRICNGCGSADVTCYGSYEDEVSWAYACDNCCGHGNEDGQCEAVAPRQKIQPTLRLIK